MPPQVHHTDHKTEPHQQHTNGNHQTRDARAQTKIRRKRVHSRLLQSEEGPGSRSRERRTIKRMSVSGCWLSLEKSLATPDPSVVDWLSGLSPLLLMRRNGRTCCVLLKPKQELRVGRTSFRCTVSPGFASARPSPLFCQRVDQRTCAPRVEYAPMERVPSTEVVEKFKYSATRPDRFAKDSVQHSRGIGIW